jgi:hypothetical protein
LCSQTTHTNHTHTHTHTHTHIHTHITQSLNIKIPLITRRFKNTQIQEHMHSNRHDQAPRLDKMAPMGKQARTYGCAPTPIRCLCTSSFAQRHTHTHIQNMSTHHTLPHVIAAADDLHPEYPQPIHQSHALLASSAYILQPTSYSAYSTSYSHPQPIHQSHALHAHPLTQVNAPQGLPC